MYLLQSAGGFDWKSLLLGEESWNFLPEVLFRSAIMFLVTLVALRLIGKRGIMQGVFEIVTIITLGSAAGDPMFYKKVGLLPGIMVFISIVMMYKITNFFVARFKTIEHMVEGKHVRLVKENRFAIENFSTDDLSKDEIFSDLRMSGVSHLGQVDAAYIEASGRMSVFFLPDDQVQYGLPVRPELYESQVELIKNEGWYACAYCGYTLIIPPAEKHDCPLCRKSLWVLATNEKRIK